MRSATFMLMTFSAKIIYYLKLLFLEIQNLNWQNKVTWKYDQNNSYEKKINL